MSLALVSIPPDVYLWADDDSGDDMPPTRMDTPTRALVQDAIEATRQQHRDYIEETRRHNQASEATLQSIDRKLSEQPSRREWTMLAGLFLVGMSILLVFFISLYVTRQGDDATAAWKSATTVVPH